MKTPERVPRPSMEVLSRLREVANRQLTREEYESYRSAPMSEEERQTILDSISWFKKRYSTPAARLASARHAYLQWTRSTRPQN